MKYFFLTGDPSGDKICAVVARRLVDQNNVDVVAWGGPHCEEAGISLLRSTEDLAVMGFKEVGKRLLFFNRLFKQAKSDILIYAPDTLVLVDYGSFNLRIAKWAHQLDIRIVYLSPPKMWASRSSRVAALKRYCDVVIVMFPFEQDFYREHGLSVSYFGHPLAEDQVQRELSAIKTIALLPGSRPQEIKYLMPVMIEAVEGLPDYNVVISQAKSITTAIIDRYLPDSMQDRVTITEAPMSTLLRNVDMAIVTSGTATMEVALAGVPQVVCYKTSAITYRIAKQIIRVKYISLVNLILDRPLVAELIQSDCTAHNIRKELQQLSNAEKINSIKIGYAEIKRQLIRKNTIDLMVDAISAKRV